MFDQLQNMMATPQAREMVFNMIAREVAKAPPERREALSRVTVRASEIREGGTPVTRAARCMIQRPARLTGSSIHYLHSKSHRLEAVGQHVGPVFNGATDGFFDLWIVGTADFQVHPPFRPLQGDRDPG